MRAGIGIRERYIGDALYRQSVVQTAIVAEDAAVAV